MSGEPPLEERLRRAAENASWLEHETDKIFGPPDANGLRQGVIVLRRNIPITGEEAGAPATEGGTGAAGTGFETRGKPAGERPPAHPERFLVHKDAPFDAERARTGARICRWCGKALEGKRTGWCGKACVDEFLVRRSGADARRVVFRRDRGVCALCKVDTRALVDRLHALRFPPGNEIRRQAWEPDRESYVAERRRLEQLGYDLGRSLWEADHIVPVVEGGGGCGPENLRTLCVPCHRRETADLAGRRASHRALARDVVAGQGFLPFMAPA